MYGRIVDQDGKSRTTEGQKLIDNITAKFSSDIKEIQEILKRRRIRDQEYWRFFEAIKYSRQAATWLFAGAPPEVVDHLRSELENRGRTPEGDVIEAAGRSFIFVEDLRMLYEVIVERIHHPGNGPAFPIHSASAICRILELREFGPDALTRDNAKTFMEQALIDMERCAEQQNFKQKFFQAVKLFLYLLRYREIDQDFLRYENTKDCEIFNRLISCLEYAKVYFHRQYVSTKNQKVADMIVEIKKYMFFEGRPDFDIVSILNEHVGE